MPHPSPKRRRARQPSLISRLVPDQIEALYANVDLGEALKDLLARFGEPVRPVVVALLCDPHNDLRATAEAALNKGTTSAVAVIVPLLVAQFALAPAVALAVAALVVRALATHGREKLCEELAPPRARPRPRRAKPAGPRRPVARKRKR